MKREETETVISETKDRREYDEKLLKDYEDFLNDPDVSYFSAEESISLFINHRYPNESILKQIAEHKAKIEELKKKLI